MYPWLISNYTPEDYLEISGVLPCLIMGVRHHALLTVTLSFQAVPQASADKEVLHTCVLTHVCTQINDP